ncbi:MAG: hypothetical protein ACRESQ_01680 [Gammaproteobacteria bacterium]
MFTLRLANSPSIAPFSAKYWRTSAIWSCKLESQGLHMVILHRQHRLHTCNTIKNAF